MSSWQISLGDPFRQKSSDWRTRVQWKGANPYRSRALFVHFLQAFVNDSVDSTVRLGKPARAGHYGDKTGASNVRKHGVQLAFRRIERELSSARVNDCAITVDSIMTSEPR